MKYYIDLGTYEGRTLQKATEVFADRDFYIGVEPIPELFKNLTTKFVNNPKIKLYNFAADDHDGAEKFFISTNKDASFASGSILFGDKRTGNIKKDNYIEMQTVNFARFVEEQFLDGDDIILKMNIEGAEYRVLDCLMSSNKIKMIGRIFCSWHWAKIGIPQRNHEKFVRRLQSFGFKLTGENKFDAFTSVYKCPRK